VGSDYFRETEIAEIRINFGVDNVDTSLILVSSRGASIFDGCIGGQRARARARAGNSRWRKYLPLISSVSSQ